MEGDYFKKQQTDALLLPKDAYSLVIEPCKCGCRAAEHMEAEVLKAKLAWCKIRNHPSWEL